MKAYGVVLAIDRRVVLVVFPLLRRQMVPRRIRAAPVSEIVSGSAVRRI